MIMSLIFAALLRTFTRLRSTGHRIRRRSAKPDASTNLLALVGAINVAFVASFLAAATLASSAVAASDAHAESCGGQDLMDRLAQTNPQTHASIMEQAEATPFGDAILLRIEKPGIAPSHLFGTMHLTDPRVTDLPDPAADALAAADTVAIETTDILDEQAVQLQLLGNPEMTMFTDGRRLSDFLEPDEKILVAQALSERGMKLALFERMKPWILSGMLALPACEMNRKADGAAILDIAIAEAAQASGQELVGLETMMEQLEAMASLPMDTHIDGLVETLRMGALVDDTIETMILLYERGEVGTIWPMLRAISEDLAQGQSVGDGGQLFEEIMVNRRNATMFDRGLPLVEAGNAFIAVGALHLPGENGLGRMFERAGYTVTPVTK